MRNILIKRKKRFTVLCRGGQKYRYSNISRYFAAQYSIDFQLQISIYIAKEQLCCAAGVFL